MTEKEYKAQATALIEQAKAALNSYSAEQQAIEKLYAQAKQNASDAYRAQEERLQRESEAAKDQAVSDMLRTERNIDQTLASRGLSLSGENAQTRVDLTLALRQQLAKQQSDTENRLATLANEKNAKLADLELAQVKSRAEGAQKRAQLQGELANAYSKAGELSHETETATGGLAAVSGKPASADKNPAQTVKPVAVHRRPGESELHYLFRRALTLASAAQSSAGNATAGSNTTGNKTPITPEISARELAKQLVAVAGEEGKIGSYSQQKKLRDMLADITDENVLDSAYYNELLLNLRAMGYQPDFEQKQQQATETLERQAQNVYRESQTRYADILIRMGAPAEQAMDTAVERARLDQLLYLYTHCRSLELFEGSVVRLGLTDELNGFYEKLSALKKEDPADPAYILGSMAE